MYDELALFGEIFVQEVDQDLQPSTASSWENSSLRPMAKKVEAYEMNICKVRTDV